MRIALATCQNLPSWEIDDRPLHAALRGRGVDLEIVAWDDPAAAWASFDAALIRTTWDYTERRDDFVAWAARVAACTRLFNPAEVVAWNTHKSYLRELEGAGARLAPTIWIDRGASIDVAAAMRERGWSRGFLKPQVGATARETLRFVADDDGLTRAQAHLDRLLVAEDMILQPYLARVEVEGEVSHVFLGGRFSHAVQKIPVAGDYRVQDDWGASDRPASADAAWIQASAAIVDAAARGGEPLLYARADYLRDDDGDWVLGELEVVEPSLFFRHAPGAADHLADALLARIRG